MQASVVHRSWKEQVVNTTDKEFKERAMPLPYYYYYSYSYYY